MRLLPTLTAVPLVAMLAVSSAFAQVSSNAGAAKPEENPADVWKIVESVATVAAVIVAIGSVYVARKAGQAADGAKVEAEDLAVAANTSLAASATSMGTSAETARRALEETIESNRQTIKAWGTHLAQQNDANETALRALEEAKRSDQQTIEALRDQVAQQAKANEQAKGSDKRAISLLEDRVRQQNEAYKQAISLFQGNSVFQLYTAWDSARFLPHAKAPLLPHVMQGVRALALTATIWLGKYMDHDVLYDDYWGNYEALFQQINNLKPIVQKGEDEGAGDTVIDPPKLLTPSIRRVYREMKEHGEARVIRTSIES